MKAAWYEETGPARDVLEAGTLPDPTPDDGEVLVRVRASGVNPSDVKKRGGWIGLEMDHERVVPHSDGAGTIREVGPGVPGSRVGERVWLWNAQGPGRPLGTCAEYTVVPSEQAVRLPEEVDFVTGACLGVPACTAYAAVFSDGPVDGATVLVAGGAGAVGNLAVQWAKWGGATVVSTVSSPEKAGRAAAAGADVIIDYTTEDVAASVTAATDGNGVDRIIEVDLAANLAIDVKVLRENGTIASYSSTSEPEPVLPYYPLAFKGATLDLVQGYLLPRDLRRRAVRAINRMLAAGRLDTVVAGAFALEDVAAAHEAVEAGEKIGEIVVRLP